MSADCSQNFSNLDTSIRADYCQSTQESLYNNFVRQNLQELRLILHSDAHKL